MDAKEMGEFIKQVRKENQLTQIELAKKLNVTDKAVSRWERGLGYPDINSLEPLADALGISVVELLHAKKIEKTETIEAEKVEEYLVGTIEMSKKHSRSLFVRFVIGIFVVILFIAASFLLAKIIRESKKTKVDDKPFESYMNQTVEYTTPFYYTTNRENTEHFREVLASKGFYSYDENRKWKIIGPVDTGEIDIKNITTASISDEYSNVEVFLTSPAHSYLMVDETIYDFDASGGRYLRLCLWDYDNNGIKDLVYLKHGGSGVDYMEVGVFDLTKKEDIIIIHKITFGGNTFTFEIKADGIYISDELLRYEKGAFVVPNKLSAFDGF